MCGCHKCVAVVPSPMRIGFCSGPNDECTRLHTSSWCVLLETPITACGTAACKPSPVCAWASAAQLSGSGSRAWGGACVSCHWQRGLRATRGIRHIETASRSPPDRARTIGTMRGISRKRAWGSSKAAGIQKLSPTIDACCMASYRARRKKMRASTKQWR